MESVCAFEGCEKPKHGKVYCNGQYRQWFKGEDLKPLRKRRSSAVRRTCTVAGCTDPHNAHGMCITHYKRWVRHQSFDKPVKIVGKGADNPNWVGSSAAYMTVHSRIRTARGWASEYSCVECGVQALDWAYTYDCPNEIPSKSGPYSVDIERYQPMCRRCHRRYDYKMADRVSA